jgi:Spy/CpxP family protein refolding chaperone
MLYSVLYMASTRTQIYLTHRQRAKLDEIMRREHKSMAQVVREALDAYFAAEHPDADAALAATFGSAPAISVPAREEWDRD